MAHENLKFKLDLNDNKEWQPILGAQEFGTFFMVYIRFNKVENMANELGVDVVRYNCSFRLQNFDGAITIGFCGKPKISINPDKNDEISTYINLPLGCFVFKELEDIVEDLPLEIPTHKPLMTLYTVRVPNNTDTKNQKFYNADKPMTSQFLHPYKYERDGDGAYEIGRRPLGSTGEFKSLPDAEEAGGGPLGICSPNTSMTYKS